MKENQSIHFENVDVIALASCRPLASYRLGFVVGYVAFVFKQLSSQFQGSM